MRRGGRGWEVVSRDTIKCALCGIMAFTTDSLLPFLLLGESTWAGLRRQQLRDRQRRESRERRERQERWRREEDTARRRRRLLLYLWVAISEQKVKNNNIRVARPRGPKIRRDPTATHWWKMLHNEACSLPPARSELAQQFRRNLRLPPCEVGRCVCVCVTARSARSMYLLCPPTQDLLRSLPPPEKNHIGVSFGQADARERSLV